MTFSILHRATLLSIITITNLACSSNSENTSGAGGNQGTSAFAGASSTEAGTRNAGGSSTMVGSSPAGGSSSNPGTSSAVGGSSSVGSCDVKSIMQTACSGIVCHGSPGHPAMYNTDFFNPPAGETLEQTLIGTPANYDLVADPSKCPKNEPELLIDPSTPAASLILKKITNTQACGVKMPNSSTPLTQEQIDCFVQWVNAATGNGGAGGASSRGTSLGGSGSGGRSMTGGAASTGGGAGNEVPATFQTVKTILTDSLTPCVSSDCHGGHPGRLNLLVDDGLLGRLTSSTSAVCNMPVVDSGNPGNSALVKVMREGCGDVRPNCLIGTQCIPRMPLNCTDGADCIPESYIRAVEQWIASGAQP